MLPARCNASMRFGGTWHKCIWHLMTSPRKPTLRAVYEQPQVRTGPNVIRQSRRSAHLREPRPFADGTTARLPSGAAGLRGAPHASRADTGRPPATRMPIPALCEVRGNCWDAFSAAKMSSGATTGAYAFTEKCGRHKRAAMVRTGSRSADIEQSVHGPRCAWTRRQNRTAANVDRQACEIVRSQASKSSAKSGLSACNTTWRLVS